MVGWISAAICLSSEIKQKSPKSGRSAASGAYGRDSFVSVLIDVATGAATLSLPITRPKPHRAERKVRARKKFPIISNGVCSPPTVT
jgi:hypothetical protein